MSRYQGHPDRHRYRKRRRPSSKSCARCHHGLVDGQCPNMCFTGRTYEFQTLLCGCDPILLEAPGTAEPCSRCGTSPVTVRARSYSEALERRRELSEPVLVAA